MQLHQHCFKTKSNWTTLFSLQEILYYVAIQFVTAFNYPSFATLFNNFTANNHLFNILIIFVTMVQLLNFTSFHID